MTDSAKYRVLVVLLSPNPAPELVRLALRSGWPCIVEPRSAPAARHLRQRRPAVVLIEVALPAEEEIRFIRLLQPTLDRRALVAVARSHDENLERAIRAAGVSCYLPSANDDAAIEAIVAAMLGQRPVDSQGPPAKTASAPNIHVPNVSSSSRVTPAFLDDGRFPPVVQSGARFPQDQTVDSACRIRSHAGDCEFISTTTTVGLRLDPAATNSSSSIVTPEAPPGRRALTRPSPGPGRGIEDTTTQHRVARHA